MFFSMKLCLAILAIFQGVIAYFIDQATEIFKTKTYIFIMKAGYGISMIIVLVFLEW